MERTSFILLLVISLFLSYCGSPRPLNNREPNSLFDTSSLPPTSKNGACYTKYVTQDRYINKANSFLVYTGNNSKQEVNFEIQQIEVTPAKSAWVRKKLPPEDCIPNKSNDCVVACLEETPAIYKEFKVLKDTTQTKDFELVNLDQEVLLEKGGLSYWIEIVCAKNMTPSLLKKVQMTLIEKGYYSEAVTGLFDEYTRESLKKFQATERLPIGTLNLETMKALGISVK